MRVERVELCGPFMGHAPSATTTIRLPPRGVAVVRGPNGAGKSSLIEAVSWGVWGKTLRGSRAWPRDKSAKGSVAVHANGHPLVRTYERGASIVKWNATDYQTATKAAEDIDRTFGEHDVWMRTHVLSASIVGAFSRATDAERKRLVESVLGLTVLEEAGKAALVGKHEAVARYERASVALTYLRTNVHLRADFLRRAEVELATARNNPPAPSLPSPKDIGSLSSSLHKLEEEKNELVAEQTFYSLERTDILTSLDGMRNSLKESVCPTCRRPFPATHEEQDHPAALAARVRELEKELEEVNESLRVATRSLHDKTLEVARAKEQLEQATRAQVDGQVRVAAYAATLRGLEVRVTEASTALAEAEDSLDGVEADEAKAALEVKTMEVVCRVLGLHGLRALILTRALDGVGVLANLWLARLLPGAVVQFGLRQTATKEELSLSLQGVAGGEGYEACSSGQQRRVDLCILLALAEVAASAAGVPPGTLFVDEAFDTLDSEGKEAVADVLDDLSASRCIVVITHSEELASLIRNPAARFSVESGQWKEE